MISRRGLLMTLIGVPITGTTVSTSDARTTHMESAGFLVTGQLSDAGGRGEYALGTELFFAVKPQSTAQQHFDGLVGAQVCMAVTRGACE